MLLTDYIARAEAQPGVYVLRGSNGQNYTGAARNLRDRLRDHQAGRASRTRNQRPLWVVYVERCADYSAALKRERFLKSGQGRDWLKAHQTVSP